MYVEQRPNAIRRAKTRLIEQQNDWLEANAPEDLYAHVIHSWRVERILDFTADVSGKVLDVGCFDGFVAEKIMKQGGKEVIGMDRLEKALELAKARGVQTVLADVDDAVIDFLDSYFDCVVAGEVLDYVFDPDAVIEEVRRVLKPGGKLIITVPNLTSIGNRILMILGRPPYSLDVRPCQGGYWRYFTFDTMRTLLSDHGFDIREMESSVFVCPLIRMNLGRWPAFAGFFPPKPEWQQPRIFFSKSLAHVFPKLGENIVIFAEKPVRSLS